MPLLLLEALVSAPASVCCDVARDLGLHVASATGTGERLVSRTGSGLAQQGEEITWEARHLGVRQRLTVRITRMEPPHLFVDEQVRGAFAWFVHTHEFHAQPDGRTRVVDRFDYRSPLGLFGRLADALVVERHMRRFLEERMRVLKEEAERRAP